MSGDGLKTYVVDPKKQEAIDRFSHRAAAGHINSALALLGIDTMGDLEETPSRWVKAFQEMTSGYREDPALILSKVFHEDSDGLVILKEIPFTSLCEHHLLPFSGLAHIGYLPSEGCVVGVSKLARIVDCFAKRLQIQERMTRQIAGSIQEHLRCLGSGVVVDAKHSCMGCRGVKKPSASMVTSWMLGALREDRTLRAEFLGLIRP